jgi:hypothetical protein
MVNLEESLGYYKVLRNRFISTFKRDKLHIATLVEEGNAWAHEGNASRDADLYESIGGRINFSHTKNCTDCILH